MRRFASPLLSLAAVLSLSLIAVTPTSASTGTIPTGRGGFNQVPTISFPPTAAPTTLTVKVLHQGTGAIVRKRDCLVADYVGQLWRGKIFDTSFTRQLSGFPIGVGQVIPGWDDALVGKRVGSQILLVVPPKYGYGSKGNSTAGIKGTDTLVFVIDIEGTYSAAVTADVHATPVTSTVSGISVTGSLASVPKISIPTGTKEVAKASITLLARGHGALVKPGLVVLQTLVTNWTGAIQASTWALGTPDSELVGQTAAPSLLDSIVGKPIGSRWVALVPKNGTSGPYIVVVDVVAQPHGLASQPS